jgi:hypothetical protein
MFVYLKKKVAYPYLKNKQTKPITRTVGGHGGEMHKN